MLKVEKGKEILYLTRQDCLNVNISNEEIIDTVERGLTYQAKKEIDMPPKIGIHPLNENTFLHAMPSYISNESACGIKWVSGFPENPKKHNLPHISGLLILNDDQTGLPLAVMDATWITTVRTVAASMIGAKYLGNTKSETFGMIGCGDIGENHIRFISSILPNLKEIFIYDKYEATMDRLISELQPTIEAKIIKASSMEEVIKNSLIVASATIFSKPNPQIKDEWVTDGQTILLCDSHTLYEDKTIKRGDQYIIDSIEQGRHFEKLGYYTDGLPKIDGELGEVVAGMKKGREKDTDLIINNNIGMALEDIIVGKALYNRALEKGIGQTLPL